MNQNETRERDVREIIRRSTVAKPLRERCEQIARAAGFEKQLAGPHDYHAWMKQLSYDRVIFIARPAPFGLRQDKSWIGHHGDPDRPYWSLTFGQVTPDRRQYQVLDVVLEQTLAEAIALADALETDADFLNVSLISNSLRLELRGPSAARRCARCRGP